jgi:hypothetical protein
MRSEEEQEAARGRAMKAYKIEILVVDHDEVGKADIVELIENVRYPNHALSPVVLSIIGRDIGEWHDDHPLNQTKGIAAEVKRIFK